MVLCSLNGGVVFLGILNRFVWWKLWLYVMCDDNIDIGIDIVSELVIGMS